MRNHVAWMVAVLLAASGTPGFPGFLESLGFADEVLLEDGSKVIGEVRRMGEGKLHVKTDWAGTIQIDQEKVRGVTTTQPVQVQTAEGQRMAGPLHYDAQQKTQTVQTPAAPQPVNVQAVESAWVDPADSPEAAALAAQEPAWQVHLEAGIDGQTGNTQRLAGNGRAEVRRDTETSRFLTYLAGRYARDSGEESMREVTGGASLEQDFSEHWFAFAKLDLENDRFEDLDLRVTSTGGLGYFLIRELDQELKVRGGVGYQYEMFRRGGTDGSAVGEAGLDYRANLTSWLAYTHETTYYPTFEDLGDFRLVMENAARIPLTRQKDWSLKLGVRHQYDAQPEEGVERLDTFYFLNLVWDWR